MVDYSLEKKGFKSSNKKTLKSSRRCVLTSAGYVRSSSIWPELKNKQTLSYFK